MRDLETIIVLVFLTFNFIPQSSHHSQTLTRSLLNYSATATLTPGDGTTAIKVDLWHMPHSVVLLTSPKNNNSCYPLFEQPSSGHFQRHLASHPTSAPLLTTSSPLPSPLTVTSRQDQKGLTPLLALLLVSIHDAFLTTYALLPGHLSEDSHHENLKLSHTHQIILTLKFFIAEMEF